MLILCHNKSSFAIPHKDSVALPGKEQNFLCFPYSKSFANPSRKLRIKADSNKLSPCAGQQECKAEQKPRTLTSALWQHQTLPKRNQLVPVRNRTINTFFHIFVKAFFWGVPEITLGINLFETSPDDTLSSWLKKNVVLYQNLKCSCNYVLWNSKRSWKSLPYDLGKEPPFPD